MRSTLSLRTVSQALPLKQFYFGILRGGPFSVFVHQSCIFVHQVCVLLFTRHVLLFISRVLLFTRHVLLFISRVLLFTRHVLLFISRVLLFPRVLKSGAFFFVTQMSLLTCLERL